MKKQKVLILHFPNLNNYGTGMMGLITIQSLSDRYGPENIEFYCDFDDFADINEIISELKGEITLKRYENKPVKKIGKIKNVIFRKFCTFLHLLFYFEGKGFDKMIVLGGDDLSEYYSSYGATLELLRFWKASFQSKVILFGQTIGPFKRKINRAAFKYLLPRIIVYARDPWCVDYIKKEFGINIYLMSDIALLDLPLQGDPTIELELMKKFGLTRNEYFTIAVSGLQMNNFYCDDYQIYLQRHKEIIEKLADLSHLKNKKICLLAHTFPPYADEASGLEHLGILIPLHLKPRIILITDRILETRARIILGNGLFTISGRMHPAISTFQMGKPAICLSYSAKYMGVIGRSIGRNDLIIEANDPKMWHSGSILIAIREKVDYMLVNYEDLCVQIQERIKTQKQHIKTIFREL
jgi:colanic acid/amylovoran biosynthesis protein